MLIKIKDIRLSSPITKEELAVCEQLGKHIRRNGLKKIDPITIDKNKRLLIGRIRIAACMAVGYKMIKAVVYDK